MDDALAQSIYWAIVSVLAIKGFTWLWLVACVPGPHKQRSRYMGMVIGLSLGIVAVYMAFHRYGIGGSFRLLAAMRSADPLTGWAFTISFFIALSIPLLTL